MSLEFSFDTLGPIARTVEDVAKTLEVIAGEDIRAGVKMDDRQPVGVEADNYTDALKENIEGASIGILENGFDWEFSHPEVDSAVIDATEVLNELEAETEHVTMDLHDLGLPLLLTMAVQGISRMGAEASVGTNHNGWFWTHLAKGLGKAQRSQSHDLPFTVKTWLLAAEHLHDEYGIEYYSKAKNIALEAERRYNVLFDDYDAIVLPTVPVLPNKVETDLDRLEMAQGVERTHNMSANTAMFSLTHHPAISVPCATVEDDLPVGMMFVADHFDEKSLIRCASAYEREANVSLYNN
jgi:amidase